MTPRDLRGYLGDPGGEKCSVDVCTGKSKAALEAFQMKKMSSFKCSTGQRDIGCGVICEITDEGGCTSLQTFFSFESMPMTTDVACKVSGLLL